MEVAGQGDSSTEVANPAAARSPESRQFLARVRDDVKARIFGTPPDGPTPHEPIRIGRYVVIKRIGIGGMGLIYAAYDDALDRKVAVKLLRPERMGASTGQARLLREAQAIARLSHPSVVGVYEVGTHEDQVFIAMEYVDGVTLQRWQATRSWREILEAYIAAGAGLAAAHAAGIVHRDFKADNVLVRKDGAVRVLDFGLARTDFEQRDTEVEAVAGASPEDTSLTRTGTVMGTPAYMAPEQHMGLATDPRTDQFSFCVSLHEALYGYRPFAGTSLHELRENVLAGKIEPEPRYTEVPIAIRRALLRGLSADPALRFPDLASLLRELAPQPAKTPWRIAAVAAGLVSIAAGATVWWDAVEEAELREEGERLRAQFEQTRIVNAEAELRRLRKQSVSERWDEFVLGFAEDAVAENPTLAIAALKHLTPGNTGWLAAARTIAADASRRGPVHRERMDFGALLRLDFDEHRVLAQGRDGRMHVWDLAQDRVQTFAAPPNVVLHGFVLDTHDAARGAGSDGKLYRLGTDAPPLTVSNEALFAIAAGGDRIAVGDALGEVFVIAADDTIERELRRHEGPVRALAFHPDDAGILASGGDDHVVWVSFLDRRTNWTLEHDTTSRRLFWTRSNALLSVAPGGTVHGWGDDGRAFEPEGYPAGVRDLAVDREGTVKLHHDGTTLAASVDETVPLELDQHEGHVSCIAVSSDGQFIAAAKDSMLQVWHTGPDARGRRALGEVPIDGGDGMIASVVRIGDDGELLTVSREGDLRRWAADGTHALAVETDLEIASAIAAPDGRRIAVEDDNGAAHVVDLADARGYTMLGRVYAPGFGAMAWSPDGTAIAKLSCRATCLLAIHPADGGVPVTLGNVGAEGRSLRYSDDGRHLASEHGREVVLWNVATGDGERVELPATVAELIGYAFVDDGLRIAAAVVQGERRIGAPRSLRVWQAGLGSTRAHELFAEADLRLLLASDDRDAVLMQTVDERVLVWFLAEDRFVLLPDGLLPSDQVTRLRVAPGRDAVLLDVDGGRRAMLVDLASGQRRTLPALVDPVAWTDDGTVVDVVGGHRLRRWVDPTPEDPREFLVWLSGVTTIEIDANALR